MATGDQPEPSGRKAIPPAVRRRLQQQFEHGGKMTAKGDFKYACDMFEQCVLGDPGNLFYLQGFLNNLHQWFGNSKKGSKLAGMKGMGAKTHIKKSKMSKDWPGVIKAGIDLLKLNPWDVATLTDMAIAAAALECNECQLQYLRAALDFNPADVEVNRMCGRVLADQGLFDQSIACWQRLVKIKPDDEEAKRALANLAIEKTIVKGKYEDAESTKETRADRGQPGDDRPGSQLTPEQRLEKAIGKSPEVLSNYLDLADMHQRNERFADAEEVLKTAMQVSGGDMHVRERLEDVQVRRERQRLAIAEKKAAEERTPEASELVKKVKADLIQLELNIYRARSDRHPENTGYKFEVGLRLRRAGQYAEAIPWLQAARQDAKRAAVVFFELGECFRAIGSKSVPHQNMAMQNYQQALATWSERDLNQRKLTMYRIGDLAMFMGNLDTAEQVFTELAGMDFGYRDVADRLDKIAEMRNKG